MQIENILTLALIGLAAAAPLNPADIVKALSDITTSLKILDTAAASFPDITARSNIVSKTIELGNGVIKSMIAVSLVESLPVDAAIEELITTGEIVVSGFYCENRCFC